MWRSPASLLKVRPQWGHFVLSESGSPAAVSLFWMASAFTCACSSPETAFAARIAWRNASDSFCHLGMAWEAFSLSAAEDFTLGSLSDALASLAALAMRSLAFSRSPSRFAALLNCLRFCWKTFLQIRMCLSRLSLLNCLPQSGQGTRGPPSSTPAGNSLGPIEPASAMPPTEAALAGIGAAAAYVDAMAGAGYATTSAGDCASGGAG
mmetsp:Transcript_101305/g.261800  ORF Transcript_101305/g.261800 Transcript_101305/m.261800 type:complete len:208 (-) Transcript_101305:8-631(-)